MHYNKTDEIISAIRKELDTMEKKLDVRRIGLFGSYSRGSRVKGGQIDILVELGKESIQSYFQLQKQLEQLTGEKVKLYPLKLLKPLVKPHVLKEVIYV